MLPISYLIGVIMGIVVFSIFVGGIIAMIYFLWYQKRVVKNIPNNMKGGTNNAEDKNEEEGGGEGRSNRERTRGESKRRWFRRRKDPTTKINAGFKHGVQVSDPNPNPKPKPKPKPKPREDRTNSKQSWPSFS
tara:strand:- start:90 stop:488 length:399 start_codon:yes stop_codon:yes gene_type:complete